MADDKVEPRDVSPSQRLPWLHIFQSFRLALDLNKLLLAAAGLVVMAAGWWLLALVFNYSEPEYGNYSKYGDRQWEEFKADHTKWGLIHKSVGNPSDRKTIVAADVAKNREEFELLRRFETGTNAEAVDKLSAKERDIFSSRDFQVKLAQVQANQLREAGRMRSWPWNENRGPNPYLLATNPEARSGETSVSDWLLKKQLPVLLEPLVKLMMPIILFFHPDAGTIIGLYALLVLFWTVVTWAIFGGAITRIAAVQFARQEKITLSEAVRFTAHRWVSFVTAPLFPLLFVGFLMLFMILFGFFHMIPLFGDTFVSGLLWWLMMIFGLLMAVGLLGLVGWPLMSATISTEGTDSWEAVSRSYSYVFQAPWHYVWYGVVALAYGAVVIFFVGFMGSFAVYLSKWGVSQTPFIKKTDREPSFLFVYAPESFGWRNLLLKGVTVNGQEVVDSQGRINRDAYRDYIGASDYTGKEKLTWYNQIGAGLVAFWVTLFFLLIVGFGYSYFWTSSTVIYFLMRKKVDDAEMDEVYLEEDDMDSYQGPLAPTPSEPMPAPAPTAPAATAGAKVTMLEAPTLRAPAAAPAPLVPPPPAAVPDMPMEEPPKPAETPPPPSDNNNP